MYILCKSFSIYMQRDTGTHHLFIRIAVFFKQNNAGYSQHMANPVTLHLFGIELSVQLLRKDGLHGSVAIFVGMFADVFVGQCGPCSFFVF